MDIPIRKISAEEHSRLMETMRDNVGFQGEPRVGMFWYNSLRRRLIGVKDAYAAELVFNAKGRKTLKVLHAKVWSEIREEAIRDGIAEDMNGNLEEYTQVPRGRVFQVDMPGSGQTYFEVLVGSWINDCPEAVRLIVDHFNLSGVAFDFIESEHWNIGRGTSEIFLSEGF